MKKLTIVFLALFLIPFAFSQETRIEVSNLASDWYTLNSRNYLTTDNKVFCIGWRGIVEISNNSKFIKVKKKVNRKMVGECLDKTLDEKNNLIITATKRGKVGFNIFLASLALDNTSKSIAFKTKELNGNLPCSVYSNDGKNYVIQIEKNKLNIYSIDFKNSRLSLIHSQEYKYCKTFKSPSNEMLIASIQNDSEGNIDYKLEKFDFTDRTLNEISSFSFESEYDESFKFDVKMDLNDISRVVIIGMKTIPVDYHTFRTYVVSELNIKSKIYKTKIIDDKNLEFNSLSTLGLTVLFLKDEIRYFEETKVRLGAESNYKEGKLEYIFEEDEERSIEFKVHERFQDPYSLFSLIDESDKEKIRKKINDNKTYISSSIDAENNLISNIIYLERKNGKIFGSWTRNIASIE